MTTTISISADRPKEELDEDLLGHPKFAKILSDCILQYEHEDCLVLGLYGDWGSGKSTILNFVKRHLENGADEQDAEKPIIVNFNPWWFSGKDHMARAFMNQLGSSLSEEEGFEILREMLPQLLGSLAEYGGYPVISRLIRSIAEYMGVRSNNIDTIKDNIKNIILKEKKRILVLIDDMDRLTSDETCQLLTVVKALANFPNTIYLLAFDPKVTSQAIEKRIELPGDRYLEKIIQVPFHVPEVSHFGLSKMFLGYIEKYQDDLESRSNRDWRKIYNEGIVPLIRVPRGTVRLANAVKVGYPPVRAEVSFIDFIAIQALRIFFHDLYKFIYSNRVTFLYGVKLDAQGIEIQDHMQKFYARVVEQIPDDRKETVMHLLELLFPNLKPDSSRRSAEQQGKWKQDGRVCSEDLFDLYFSLDVSARHIGITDMDRLWEAAVSSERFETVLMGRGSADKSGDVSRARLLLAEMINRIPDDITEDKIWNIVAVLFDIGDQLVDSFRVGGLMDDNAIRISIIVSKLLRADRFQPEQIHDILKSAISGGEAIFTQCYHLWEMDKSDGNDSRSAYTSVEIDLAALTAIWLNRVVELANNSILFQHPELPLILSAWCKWGDKAQREQLCQAVARAIDADSGFLQFLNKFVAHGIHIQVVGDSRETREVVSFRGRSGIERYIDINACADRLRSLQKGGGVPSDFEETVLAFFEWYDHPDRESGDSGIEGS